MGPPAVVGLGGLGLGSRSPELETGRHCGVAAVTDFTENLKVQVHAGGMMMGGITGPDSS
jgi:hypothetical protein